MKLLIPIECLDKYGARDPIPLQCCYCNNTFYRPKNLVCRGIKGTKSVNYCSTQCAYNGKKKPIRTAKCKRCDKEFVINKGCQKQIYCSQQCASLSHPPLTEQQRINHSEAAKKTWERRRRINIDISSQDRYSFKSYCTQIKYGICLICQKTFAYKKGTHKKYCSDQCRKIIHSNRCKSTLGMCKNNNHHAGWYESPIAGKVWLESSWEVRCAKILDKQNIPWVRPKNSFEWIDENSISHKYYPDFFLLEKNLYLDPKNPHRQKIDAFKIAYVKEHHKINLLILGRKDIEENSFLALIGYSKVEAHVISQ